MGVVSCTTETEKVYGKNERKTRRKKTEGENERKEDRGKNVWKSGTGRRYGLIADT